MKINTQNIIQRSIQGNTFYFSYFNKSLFLKEGEHLSYKHDEELPKSLVDEINKNGCNVINFNLMFSSLFTLKK